MSRLESPFCDVSYLQVPPPPARWAGIVYVYVTFLVRRTLFCSLCSRFYQTMLIRTLPGSAEIATSSIKYMIMRILSHHHPFPQSLSYTPASSFPA